MGGGVRSGQGSDGAGVGLFEEESGPCPRFSGQLTQKGKADLPGRPRNQKDHEGCTGKGSVKEEICNRQRCPKVG